MQQGRGGGGSGGVRARGGREEEDGAAEVAKGVGGGWLEVSRGG